MKIIKTSRRNALKGLGATLVAIGSSSVYAESTLFSPNAMDASDRFNVAVTDEVFSSSRYQVGS